MGLTSGEILDVINIAYYGPALFISIFVASRHGFRRSNGWLYLVPLALVRIVGSSLGIVATSTHKKTESEIAAILSSVGLTVLIQALVGFLRRINEGCHKDHRFNPRFIDLFTIPLIVAIGLGIDGGIQMSKAGDYSSGQDKFKITGIILLALLAALTALTIFSSINRSWLPPNEFRLVGACAFCLPVLLVRVVYVLCIGFADSDSTTFNLLAPDVTVEGIMSSAPEFIVVTILLLLGLVATRARNVAKVGPPPIYEMERQDQRTFSAQYPSQPIAWAPSVATSTAQPQQ
ncbi:MAG: hypothetical protein Q9162_001572 [Coniocarpon cinnabarinum]